MTSPRDDRTPEEKIADSVNALSLALSDHFFFDDDNVAILAAATPEITKHYLKGQ